MTVQVLFSKDPLPAPGFETETFQLRSSCQELHLSNCSLCPIGSLAEVPKPLL